MTESDYRSRLNDYHIELSSAVDLTSHLLSCLIDINREEWEASGAWLMQNKLRELAENLPFPPAAAEVGGAGTRSLAAGPGSPHQAADDEAAEYRSDLHNLSVWLKTPQAAETPVIVRATVAIRCHELRQRLAEAEKPSL